MRNGISWAAFALIGALLFADAVQAQPPGRRGGPRGGIDRTLDDLKLSDKNKETARDAVGAYQDNVRRLTDLASVELLMKLKDIVSPEEFTKIRKATETARGDLARGGPGRGPGRGISTNDMVERLMSFDKNKDGKITKDELPERMQNLIARGDTNKDGVLDKDEVKKLAAELAREESGGGRGPGGRGRPGPANDGGRLTPAAVERAVGDLKLVETKKESARAAVKACQENVLKLTDLARADLVLRVSAFLGEEDLKTFKTAVDRLPTFNGRPGCPGGPGGRPPFRRPAP
jgi:EF hand